MLFGNRYIDESLSFQTLDFGMSESLIGSAASGNQLIFLVVHWEKSMNKFIRALSHRKK